MELTGRVALITGGEADWRGGRAELAARGVDVAVAYAPLADGGATDRRASEGAGRRGAAFQADLSNADACAALVARAADEFGRLDILINMASRLQDGPVRRARRPPSGTP